MEGKTISKIYTVLQNGKYYREKKKKKKPGEKDRRGKGLQFQLGGPEMASLSDT